MIPEENQLLLPTGVSIFWDIGEVGERRYWTDEVGGGAMIWNTAFADVTTMSACLAQELSFRRGETMANIARIRKENADKCQQKPFSET
jgi:hypothetical protein